MAAETEETTVVEDEAKSEGETTASVEEALSDAHDAIDAKPDQQVEAETTEEAPASLTTEQVEQRETEYAAKVKTFEEREARHNQDRDAYMQYRDQLDGRETPDKPQGPKWLTMEPETDNEKLLHAGLKEVHEGRQKDRSELDYYRDELHKERVKNNAAEIAVAKKDLQERFPDFFKDPERWPKAERLTIDLIRAAQGRSEDYSITELLTHNVQALAQPGSDERARADVHKTAGASAKARVPAGGPAGARKEIGTIEQELERGAREAGME